MKIGRWLQELQKLRQARKEGAFMKRVNNCRNDKVFGGKGPSVASFSPSWLTATTAHVVIVEYSPPNPFFFGCGFFGRESPCATNGAVGHMTIFYCGKVNVYEVVPPDKAQAIMNLAASPVHLPQDDTIGRPGGLWSFPYHLPAPNDKDHLIPPSTTISQMMQTEKIEYSQQYREKGNITRDPDVEGQANRKVSLQRYLEKRKDRGRLKSKKSTGLPSPSLEMYLNHQVRTNTPNGNSSRSSTSSPPQHGLPPALSNSSNNQPKSAGLAVDLNDKDAQEC